jgi:cell division protein FtsL
VRAAAARNAAPPPRVLTVRRPLVRPTGDPRRLLHAMRRLLVRRVFILFVLLVVLGMARVWLRLQVVNLGYELSAAREMQTRLEQEGRELAVELAMLKDRSRLEELARRRLGMTDPKKGQVVELR